MPHSNFNNNVNFFFQRLLRMDEHISISIYKFAEQNKFVKYFADLFSLSSDEIIWFGIPSFIGCSMFTIRGFGLLGSIGCIEEAFWDCFGSCAVCTTVESFLKFFFQRTRPKYAKQSESYCIFAECFSFPSGHCMRAFYFLFWLNRSVFVKLIAEFVIFPDANRMVPWAILVGWSRVSKGRHFLLDVFIGGIIGYFFGYFVEVTCDTYWRTLIKTFSGTYTVLCWGGYVVIPTLGGKSKEKYLNRLIAGFCFYLFAVRLLYSTLPPNYDVIGSQTIISEQDKRPTCTQLLW